MTPMLSEFESAVISDAWAATVHHRGQPARLTALLMWPKASIRLVAIRVVSVHGEKETRGPWRPYAPGLVAEFLSRAASVSSDDAAAVEVRGHAGRWFVYGQPCSSQGRVGLGPRIDTARVTLPADVPEPTWAATCRQNGRVRAWRVGWLMGRLGFGEDANPYEAGHGSGSFHNAWNDGYASARVAE